MNFSGIVARLLIKALPCRGTFSANRSMLCGRYVERLPYKATTDSKLVLNGAFLASWEVLCSHARHICGLDIAERVDL